MGNDSLIGKACCWVVWLTVGLMMSGGERVFFWSIAYASGYHVAVGVELHT